jgi:YegS/Rv2252/BmrU family lipid kinase
MAEKRKKYVLVVNLKSRQSAKAVEKIEEIFKTRKAQLVTIAVKDPKKIKAAFQKALDAKADGIILGGGDGTLISGIEYLSLKDYQKPIGLLPLGTANYLTRNLGIPLDLDGSIEVLLKGKSKQIPIGVANEKFFALTFIIGLTQRVAQDVSDDMKRKFGQLAYILELIKQTKDHKAFTYIIESSSLKRRITGKTHQIIVYNSDINLQLKLVPDHSLQKNKLKVVVSRCGRSKTKLYAGFLIHIASLGRFRPYMHVFEAESLKVQTKPALTADYDGEPYSKSPFEVRLYERKVHIIC